MKLNKDRQTIWPNRKSMLVRERVEARSNQVDDCQKAVNIASKLVQKVDQTDCENFELAFRSLRLCLGKLLGLLRERRSHLCVS